MTSGRERPLPRGKLGRLAAFGQLAGGIAAGMVGAGTSSTSKADRLQPRPSARFIAPVSSMDAMSP